MPHAVNDPIRSHAQLRLREDARDRCNDDERDRVRKIFLSTVGATRSHVGSILPTLSRAIDEVDAHDSIPRLTDQVKRDKKRM